MHLPRQEHEIGEVDLGFAKRPPSLPTARAAAAFASLMCTGVMPVLNS